LQHAAHSLHPCSAQMWVWVQFCNARREACPSGKYQPLISFSVLLWAHIVQPWEFSQRCCPA
jgi:hypothetical protein